MNPETLHRLIQRQLKNEDLVQDFPQGDLKPISQSCLIILAWSQNLFSLIIAAKDL